MAYPIRHKLLTFNGRLFGGAEQWSFGLRFIPPTGQEQVDQAQVDACATPVQTMFSSTLMAFDNRHTLDFIKLAPIGQDGHYPGIEVAVEHNFSGVTGSSTQGTFPPQCTVVCSLLTAATRGVGHIGRIYLPPQAIVLQAGGVMLTTLPPQYMGALRTMINALNGVTNLGTAAIITKTGAFGSSRPITGLRMGVVVDTQRRRRRSIAEAPQTLAL